MGAFDDLGGISIDEKPPASNAKDFADLGGTNVDPLPQPDMSAVKKVFKENIAASKQTTEGAAPKEASTYLDDWNAGWGQSVSGLMINGKMPDTVLPEHADRLARILSTAGAFAGDIPAMALGFAGGAKVAGGRGGIVGAFALPPAFRQILVDHYQKGDIQDFNDFYDRAAGVLHQTIKGAATGLAVSYAGPLAGKGLSALADVAPSLAPVLESGVAKFTAMTSSEAATMTTVGAAMDGKVPNAQDFWDNALFITMAHGAKAAFDSALRPKAQEQVGKKLMDIYAKTGLEPHQVSDLATQDPVLRQELMSKDPTLPASLKSSSAIPDKSVAINPNPELTKSVDGVSPATESEGVGQMRVEPLVKPEPVKGEPIERPEHVTKILERIGEQPKAEKVPLDAQRVYENIIDKLDPLKNMTKALRGEEAIGTKDDPYGLARSFGSVARKADYMLDFGPREFNSPLEREGTPGLTEIWKKVDDKDAYTAFQMAKHALDMDALGLKSGIDLEAAQKTVTELEGKYGKIAKQEVAFGNAGLKYLRDSGVINKDAYDIMIKKWPNHISMRRIMDTAEELKAGGGRKGMTPFNPIKAFTEEGSERQIENPLESRVKDFHKTIEMAERNRISTAVANLIDEGKGVYGNKMKTPMESVDIRPEEISKILIKHGVSSADAADIAEAMTVFRKYNQPLQDGQIAVFKDGKRAVYENVPEGIVNAMRDLNSGQMNLVVKMLSGPSKALRVGMLNSPAFAIRHFFRQEALAVSLSKDLHIPVLETVKGLTGMAGDDFGDWIMHGGGGDTIAGLDNDYIKSKVFETSNATGASDMQWNKIKNGVQFIKHGIELTDEARTFQKFRNRMGAGKDPWQAQFDARDTGIDVQRSGAAVQAYAALDPFQNIRIQGLDLIVRRIKEDPGTVIPKLMASITLPSVILWYANHDAQWYKQLTPQDRDMNWHFPVGDPDNGGHVVRMPKPFEPGVVFGSLSERLLDQWAAERPDAFKEFGKTVKDAMLPGYIPTFAQPVMEQWANKSFLTDSPLIPHHLEGINPELQQKPFTSDTAKLIAGAVRMLPIDMTQNPGSLGSPMIIDNYIRNWTGGVGQLIVSTLDTALEKSGLADKMGVDYNHAPPESVWADNPFLRSFVTRYPSTNTRAVGEFFERSKNITIQQASLKNLQQGLNVPGMQRQVQRMIDTGTMIKMTGIQNAISEQMSVIDKVTSLPGDPHQKRQLIDKLAIGVNAAAEQGNKMMDQIEKMAKDRNKAAAGF